MSMRKYFRSAKNAWNNYSEVQVWVREATSNDPWGPSSSLMARIAREAESPANYHMMFTTLWKRLTDYQQIKHVLKSLVLVDYLLKHCHERFVSDVRLRSDVIKRLRNYKFFEDGRDIGSEVRHKAQAVSNLLEDNDLLQRERRIARDTEGKIHGFSNEYSGYYGNDIDNRDPFGNVEQEERLALEYYRDEPLNNNRRDEEHKSEGEVEAEEVEEAPKKKKGKKLKKKRHSKKSVDLEQEQEREDEEEEQAQSTPPQYATEKDFFDGTDEEQESNNKKHVQKQKPKKADAVDAFLADIGNKPMLFEPDLVTGGYNSAAASQFGWLVPATTEPITHDEFALFDVIPPSKNNEPTQAAPPLNRASTQADGFLFEFGEKQPSTATPFDEDIKKEPEAPLDPWDVANRISVLDNLHETNEDRRIKQDIQDKRERMRNGPKLKDLQKKSREEQSNVNPFDAMVQGAPASEYSGPMALVPAGNFYGPNAYSQALVPMDPYGYNGYPPMYPPQMPYGQPDPYAYSRPY